MYGLKEIRNQKGEISLKATGIVRRIDDLGRVVIPKEIRRTMRIREGDPLEIFVDRNGEVILKKYSPMQDLRDFTDDYVQAISQFVKATVLVTDRDAVVSSSGSMKSQFQGKNLGKDALEVMENRTTKESNQSASINITGSTITDVSSFIISPIFSNGDTIGTVILLGDEHYTLTDSDKQTINVAVQFLGKQMET